MAHRYNRRQFLALTGAGIVGAYAAACADDNGDGTGNEAPTPTQGAGITPVASPTVDAGTDAGATAIRWFGQSMFLLTTPAGTTLLLDPFNDIGYPLPPPLDTDAAAITHEHPDHNNDALAGSDARVLRGLTSDGWQDVDEQVGDLRVFSVRSFHDDAQGSQRGRNAIFVVETAGMRVVHLGDLGHPLDDEQVDAIGGPVDALMVPVGGAFTIDALTATQTVDRLQPSLVFPMHYRTDAIPSSPLAPVDAFLEGKQVQRVGSTDRRLSRDSLPSATTVMVLDYA